MTRRGGKAVGENILENDAPCGHGKTGCRFHIFLVLFRKGRGPHRSGKVSPLYQHQSNDEPVYSPAEQRNENQGHQSRGQTDLNFHDSHEQSIEDAPEVGGYKPQSRPYQHGDEGAENPHGQTDTDAVQNTAHHVSALSVSAEPVGHVAFRGLTARSKARIHEVDFKRVVGILGRYPGGKQSGKKNKAKDDKGNGCQRTFKIFSGNPPEAAFFLSGRGGGAASHCVILLQGECGGQ